MTKKSLLWKLIIFYIGITSAVLIFTQIYITGAIERYFIDITAEKLREHARLISHHLSTLKIPIDYQSQVVLFKKMTDARITVIAPDGRVIADTDESPEGMENHLMRPEIQDAIQTGVGRSIRHSSTVRKDMLYVAVTFGSSKESQGGILRLSMTLTVVKDTINTIGVRVALASAAGLLALFTVSVLFSRSITSGIRDIVSFSRKIASGDLKHRLIKDTEDELGMLKENLNLMASDLTEKISTINRERLRFEAVLKGMIDGLLLIDRKGIVVLANESFYRLFNISDSIEGKLFIEVLRNNDLLEILEKAYNTNEFVTSDVTLQRPVEKIVTVDAVPIYGSDNKSTGTALIIHDITKIKTLEKIRRDFVANVSHELKTPVSAIKGFTETLLGGAIENRDDALKFLKIIASHVERLSRLINDLLTLSEIESGNVHLDIKPITLREVIDPIFFLLRPMAEDKGIMMVSDIPVDLPEVLADRDYLSQMLLNLLDNAIKFTPEGGNVSVRARRVKSSELGARSKEIPELITQHSELTDFVEVSVEDTGIGISPHHIPRLGERFYRIDPSRSRELGGTGLGLAIVKHLVNLHNGSLKIESAIGKGTKVSIVLPVT
ncbi:MAG: ATP-binding protein [Nitrospirota bacterium]